MPVLYHDILQDRDPEPGQLVQVRSRWWLVDEVVPAADPNESSLVRLACADDDAQGEELEVYWRHEPDRLILEEEQWGRLAAEQFEDPRRFAAFLHTMRWNCVTATDPSLFQSPFRAGIRIDAYQMEPLRKALLLPRVNLFIADDTGLGKTIEAGLIARELLLRKKVKTIVVAAPASVLEQWRMELEDRFGLIFQILDRAYVAQMRRERGFGINPWRTHSRFLVSHNLLKDSGYSEPMREWLGTFAPGSLLILDEAHHAAPSSGGRYGIESKFTRAVRDLAHRFEHRLFLSATPHNGHSNSFSTLLEILDPYRFTRGITVDNPKLLEPVMVRRLKEDIRAVNGGFPKREVVPVVIDGLPDDAPELRLSNLLDEYRTLREKRFRASAKRAQAAAGLLVVGLQQRLLSSIEAFARSLKVHRETVHRQWERSQAGDSQASDGERGATSKSVEDELLSAPDADDERSLFNADDADAAENALIESVTASAEREAADHAKSDSTARALWDEEQRLLAEMDSIAQRARFRPDAKLRRLIDWIREHLCPDLPDLPSVSDEQTGASATWTNRRVLIFTENREGTKRYLHTMLSAAIEGTDEADERIAVIDGLTAGPARKEIQRRFNADPAREPLRILLATDAAREGLNFQAHCCDLFHFDLPWNPGRIEQRNGRIDRKLQPADTVRCHYFVLPQRVEDRVLQVLVRKTETIKRELGSLSQVIDADIEKRLRQGIRHADADTIAVEIEKLDLDANVKRATESELESSRARQSDLAAQIARCEDLLEKSRDWVEFRPRQFQDALSCALEILGMPGLRRDAADPACADGREVWRLPDLDREAGKDSSWIATLDSLRPPRRVDQKLEEWRRTAPIRPVVFSDPGVVTDDLVHLHLEQRVAQRLLARFRAQGFIHHDLSRACLAHADDSIPRVILLARLCLYGKAAERLHEEIVPLTARWIEPGQRKGPLTAYARDAEEKTLRLLEESLDPQRGGSIGLPIPAPIRSRLLSSAARDVQELLPQLEERATAIAADAQAQLAARGDKEADDLAAILGRQRERVQAKLKEHEGGGVQLTLAFSEEEQRQLKDDIKAWRERLSQFDRDLAQEPVRIRDFYTVRTRRVEPVGLVYLVPSAP